MSIFMREANEYTRNCQRQFRSISKSQFEALEKRYGSLWWPEEPEFWKDPFKNLVFTVLSQNTSSENCSRAYKALSEKFEITPNAIIKADIRDIKRAIKSGGLYNIKAKRLKDLAETVVEKFNGDLTPLLALPKEKAKEKLLELPGVGNKTADVLLTTRHTYRKVIPIDTHMNRITKRLGLVKPDAKYDDIQNALMKFIPLRYRERCAGLIWLLAKHTCKPRNPRCYECILASVCKQRGTKVPRVYKLNTAYPHRKLNLKRLSVCSICKSTVKKNKE